MSKGKISDAHFSLSKKNIFTLANFHNLNNNYPLLYIDDKLTLYYCNTYIFPYITIIIMVTNMLTIICQSIYLSN